MTVQTFSASTAEAAFAKIKKTLGKGAVILDVRRVRLGVEVLAAPASERGALRRLYEAGNTPSTQQQNDLAARTAETSTETATVGHAATSAALRVVGGMALGSAVRQTLQRIDFPPDLVARLTSIAGNSDDGWERIGAWLEQCYPSLVGSLRGKVGPAMTLGFVGPRGVGRSTLVRGLAGRAAISDPGRVAWLRVGFPRRRLPAARSAPVGVDLRTAHSLAEVGRVAEDHSDVTAMLLDLPGVDVHSPSEMSALLKFVKACDENWGRVHWNAVIPATWSTREATRAVVAMKPLGVEAIAWTCIDQAGDSGTLVSSTLRTDLPPSFVHGDRVGDGGTSNAAVWDDIIAALQKVPAADEEENASEAVAR